MADGQIDLAFIAATLKLPEGVACEDLFDETTWASFVRKDHPAIASWGPAAWLRWPHVVVRVANPLPSPVTAAPSRARKRTVGARVPTFSDVAPLLARTDLIATFPILTLLDALPLYGLHLLPPSFPVAQLPHRFVWSARLGNDPAIRWIHGLVRDCFVELLKECEPYAAKLRAPRTRRGRRP